MSSWKKRKRSAVAVSSDPTSPAAEAYRSLRTSVQFARQAHELRCLLVTSPASAEGKTSTLANLGAVFAQSGERVVLVSGDLRRPQLGELFGVDEKPGLTSVLRGERTLEQALQQVEGYDGLWVLGAGAVPSNPAELLNGPGTRQLFATLRENFDLVLVDSPPVLPVTDALVLSAYADSTLLVVAAGQTRRNQLQRTAERFAQGKAPVVGIVLNEVTKENGVRIWVRLRLRLRLRFVPARSRYGGHAGRIQRPHEYTPIGPHQAQPPHPVNRVGGQDSKVLQPHRP